jgi:hypothetical protein
MRRTYQPAAASALRSFASGSPNQSTHRDAEASGTAAMLPPASGHRRRTVRQSPACRPPPGPLRPPRRPLLRGS